LIENEGKEFDPTVVYHLGKVPAEDENTNVGHFPEGVQVSRLDKAFTTYKGEDEEEVNRGFSYSESKQVLLDNTSVGTIKASIACLEEQIAQETDAEKRLEDKEKLEFLETHLKKARTPDGRIRTFRSPGKDKKRLTVYKAVSRAIQALHEELPYMGNFINKRTIEAKSTCIYRQDNSNPVKWILEPPT
jgi:hypothetical protein